MKKLNLILITIFLSIVFSNCKNEDPIDPVDEILGTYEGEFYEAGEINDYINGPSPYDTSYITTFKIERIDSNLVQIIAPRATYNTTVHYEGGDLHYSSPGFSYDISYDLYPDSSLLKFSRSWFAGGGGQWTSKGFQRGDFFKQ